MKVRIGLFIFQFLMVAWFGSVQASTALNTSAAIVDYAQKELPHEGVLTDNGRGFVYLKVDDRYIKALFPMLQLNKFVIPPYFRRKDSPGAHISVMYVEETKRLPRIEEIGKKFSFTPKQVVFVPLRNVQYIVLQVDSPDLEALRKKYNLKPKLKNHDFHITIAKSAGNKKMKSRWGELHDEEAGGN